MRTLPKRKWDNIMLGTGKEGMGKSFTMKVVLKKLDPAFDVSRIHFDLDEFLDQAPTLPPGSAILWDEARLNKRRAMHGTTLQTLDFLQDCRGLGLHIGINFPHDALLDDAVKDHRVRWNVHHPGPRRGRVQIRTRRETRKNGRSSFDWDVRGTFDLPWMSSPLVKAYDAKKELHMRGYKERKKEESHALDFQRVDDIVAAMRKATA